MVDDLEFDESEFLFGDEESDVDVDVTQEADSPRGDPGENSSIGAEARKPRMPAWSRASARNLGGLTQYSAAERSPIFPRSAHNAPGAGAASAPGATPAHGKKDIAKMQNHRLIHSLHDRKDANLPPAGTPRD